MIYTKNINLFENIDTPEKAYWLGILMADGCIAWHKTKNKIKLDGIKFGLCDKDVMDKYKKFFDIPDDFPYQVLNQPKCQPVYYLYITCHKIAEDLGKWGMVPHKTHRIMLPNLSKEIMPHFIRGYFDGDGCLYIRKEIGKMGIKKKKNILITSCSDKILLQVEEYLKQLNLIRKNINHVKYPKIYNNKQHPPYLALTNRIEVHSFLEYIYNNAIVYMDRKYKQYLEIKNDSLIPKHKHNNLPIGVSFQKKYIKNPYVCSFGYNGTTYRLGSYKTIKEAALVYNNKAIELGFPKSMLNKIDSIS